MYTLLIKKEFAFNTDMWKNFRKVLIIFDCKYIEYV